MNAFDSDMQTEGFSAIEERAVEGVIETLVVHGACDVVFRRAPNTAVAVAGTDRDACRAVDIRYTDGVLSVGGQGLGTIAVGQGRVVIASAPGAIAVGGDVWINGRRIDRASGRVAREQAMGRAAIFVTQPVAPNVLLQGSGDVVLHDIDQDEIRLQVMGSGDIEADGRTARLTVLVAGSGDIDAGRLVGDHVDCSVAGSGDVEVHAVQSVRAVVAGSGDILIRGLPPARDAHAVGSGRIRFEGGRRDAKSF